MWESFYRPLVGSSGTLQLYQCQSDEEVSTCPNGLSGGKHTRCYQDTGWDYCSGGWLEYSDVVKPNRNCGDYKCFDSGYCRYKGLIEYPRVLKVEVCGNWVFFYYSFY